MNLGVVVAQNFWIHFNEICNDLNSRFNVSVFHERTWPYQIMSSRINRYLLRHDLSGFMQKNDVVFFEWGEQSFVLATHLPKKAKIITRIHLHELWDFVPHANLGVVDRLIFVSRAMESKFLRRFPLMKGHTAVIHNGVSFNKFHLSPHPFQGVIGTLGRIATHKRVYELILALYELRRQGYDLKLKIGGSCTEKRYQRYEYEVKYLVERLHLERYVTFTGQVLNTPEWFKEVDIFVSNSISEGLQVALLEAMASGCYCLSHWWDGVDEVLPMDNIYITENELIEKIQLYCNTSEHNKICNCNELYDIACNNFNIDKQKIIVRNIIENTYNS